MIGSAASSSGGKPTQRKPRLLLVEHELPLRIFLGEMLASDYEVEAVQDGERAWEAALRQRPDLVLSDVGMPRVDGITLTRRLRADARTATVPVVLLSASNASMTFQRGMAAGASTFMLKPFRPAELLAALSAHLSAVRPGTIKDGEHHRTTGADATEHEQRCDSASENTLRIIVADDHEWIRDILVEVVRQTLPSAEMIAVEDGLYALQAFEAKGCHFLISNHQMPRMDGMGLIRAVRRVSPQLPILMVSVKPEAKTDAMEAGANWFLTKDQIMDQLPPLLLRHARKK